MATYAVVETKRKDGTIVKNEYRTDAEFKPTKIADIHIDFIENWCVANNETKWLVDTISISEYTTTKKNKETGAMETKTIKCPNGYPFVMLRADFAKKFFADIIKGKPVKTTKKDEFLKKYGKK